MGEPITVDKIKQGDWLDFGRYAPRPREPDSILWRSIGRIEPGAMSFIAAFVVTNQPFDDPRRGYADGDNRWSECTFRSRLNDDEVGFLRAFTREERAVLVPVKLKTEVLSSYQAQRRKSTDTTEDRVWVATWEEYKKKVPQKLRVGKPSPSFMIDHPDFKLSQQPNWSRSPRDGLGCVLLDLWFRLKAESNSGAAVEWGIRPWIALRRDARLTGKGTEKAPFRLAE